MTLYEPLSHNFERDYILRSTTGITKEISVQTKIFLLHTIMKILINPVSVDEKEVKD